MKKFITFLLIWISQQLAIPFWIVGHVHLSITWDAYSDVKILFASLGMNLIVAIGFWLDYKQYTKPKVDSIKILQEQINRNRESNTNTSQIVGKIVSEISQMKVYE
jgi:hypothetical protein|tara:strand:- start:1083 stop:1400 length:318 start_codon:yes stop_codon:yes gene_type:complete